MSIRYSALMFVVACLWACHSTEEKRFAIHKGPELGIGFQNTILTSDSLNALTFEYIYNGSGIGVGDFDNDGRQDLFFGGNQVSSRLYLNKGDMQFADVTEASGTITSQWVTGVSVTDINQDGRADIYLCIGGKTPGKKRKNLLFINNGIKNGTPVFTESAAAYGLDDQSYSTMAAFLDFDKDGDLDLYLVNNWLETFNRNNLRPKRVNGEAESTDKLYRNNGNKTFTDVSGEAGILIEGYGLGVNVCDLNQDSWPDIYVSNDFMSNDLLWINQRDGTFRNQIGEYFKHQTHNGMGIDVADFNNDALQDIIVVDMLPPDHKRQKLMTPGQNYDFFHMSLQQGYQPQYMRNTLQLNRGKTKKGNVLFSEMAFLAGVAKTDWSWTPLFADFDNDGWKDLFIANGYRKDVTDLDFIFFGLRNESPFGTPEKRREKLNEELNRLPPVKLSNHLFRNNGALVFEDVTKKWGIDFSTFSNGSVYADLDNDGDLDIVTNNIDQEVIVYKNLSSNTGVRNHYLKLKSTEPGTYNEKIWVFNKGKSQFFEHTPFRGYQSTVEHGVHVGLGQHSTADSIFIVWNDSLAQTFRNIKSDSTLFYSRKNATPFRGFEKKEDQDFRFEETSVNYFTHEEKSQPDIITKRTLLHELSYYGPCLAAGDVNGDKLDDILVGGEPGSSCRIFIQQPEGTFRQSDFEVTDSGEEGDALFFDADIDGDEDLYLASASPSGEVEAKPHRLYLNDGTGHLTLSGSIPLITTSASCVEACDFDRDGDPDLFVGGRIKAREYPLPPRSYILRNDGGVFRDITSTINPLLLNPGVVSSAVWTDVNNDHLTDLVIAGEWMPIRVFKNKGTHFPEITDELGLNKTDGWWNCVRAADIDGDGFTDLIAGNMGANSYFTPTQEEPVMIVARDFDNNGSIDPLITYYNPIEKNRFLVHNRLVLLDQVPSLKKKFETFTQYATTPFSKVFDDRDLKDAYTRSSFVLTSHLFVNQQGKSFQPLPLPDVAQLSAVQDMVVDDLNNDGKQDLLLIGNMHSQETLFGRYDASVGCILLGEEKFQWKEFDPVSGGFIADGDARRIVKLRTSGDPQYLVANHNGGLQQFKMINRSRYITRNIK
jgi:hypothetical protein